MKSLVIKIKGADWRVNFVTRKVFDKEHPELAGAFALTEKGGPRLIWFVPSVFSTGIAFHELLHAHSSECCIGSSSISPDDREELCCEILENHLHEILAAGKQITDFFITNVKIGKKE